MGANEMFVRTSVRVSTISWVRAGNWTSVQHVTVEKVARQRVLCKCVRETHSAKISL